MIPLATWVGVTVGQVGLGAAVGGEVPLVVGGRVVSVFVFVDTVDTGVGVDGKRNRLTGMFSAGRPSVVSRTWQVMGGRMGCSIAWFAGLTTVMLVVGGVADVAGVADVTISGL